MDTNITTLLRIQFIAELSVISQLSINDLHLAMALIADLADGELTINKNTSPLN